MRNRQCANQKKSHSTTSEMFKGSTRTLRTDAAPTTQSCDAGNTASDSKPTKPRQAGAFILGKSEEELQSLGDDLAIVCPLIDGRMRDLGQGRDGESQRA